VKRQKLQLIGVSSMFIASKYEEMYTPEIGEFNMQTIFFIVTQGAQWLMGKNLKYVGWGGGLVFPLELGSFKMHTHCGMNDGPLATLENASFAMLHQF
jgi:hypothetical protein